MRRILAIETSCDETAITLLRDEGERIVVEKNIVSSQIEQHKLTGGVVPEVAARLHVETLYPLLASSGIRPDGSDVDAIAVTYGPGLAPALRIGVEAAKTLAWAWGKPLIGVNHLEGHIYSAWLGEQGPSPTFEATPSDETSPNPSLLRRGTPAFPALILLVSGGHTELILMKDHGEYELLGRTRDDAAGEAFDKVAKLLGLGYPGGPAISKIAQQGNGQAVEFPRPMLESGDLDFSFSGLKTAVAVYLKQRPPPAPSAEGGETCADIAASFQQAVVETLVTKTRQAAERTRPACIILAGGVSANRALRSALQQEFTDLPVHIPPLEFTTDNAAMIAVAGAFRLRAGHVVDPLILEADPNLYL